MKESCFWCRDGKLCPMCEYAKKISDREDSTVLYGLGGGMVAAAVPFWTLSATLEGIPTSAYVTTLVVGVVIAVAGLVKYRRAS